MEGDRRAGACWAKRGDAALAWEPWYSIQKRKGLRVAPGVHIIIFGNHSIKENADSRCSVLLLLLWHWRALILFIRSNRSTGQSNHSHSFSPHKLNRSTSHPRGLFPFPSVSKSPRPWSLFVISIWLYIVVVSLTPSILLSICRRRKKFAVEKLSLSLPLPRSILEHSQNLSVAVSVTQYFSRIVKRA